MSQYSVFISYRRTGGDTANLIAEKLRSFGYSVFFDVESLRGGKFNEQLFSVIDKCTDFVVVLPEKALDRCADKEDWVRKEVTYAMLKGKNIVPVMLRGFEWPNPMPSGMEELQNYQAVTASDHETFDYAMQRLDSYLKAPKRNKVMISKVMAIVLTVVAILGILFAAMRLGARPACRQVGDYLAVTTGIVHEMYQSEAEMKKEWDKFLRNYEKTVSLSRRMEMKDNMRKQIAIWKDGTAQIRADILTPPTFTAMESMMLSTHGVFTLALPMVPEYAATFCDDLDSICSTFSGCLDASSIDAHVEKFMDMQFAYYEYTANAYYYAYMSELSHLPSSSKVTHEQLKKTWRLFPTTSEALSASEYDRLQQDEMDKAEEQIHDYELYIEKQDADIQKLDSRMDSLAAMASAFNEMMSYADEQVTNEQMLQLQQERVQMKGELVAQKKNELTEEKKKVLDVYNQVKSNCTLQVSDADGYQWGKILRMAKMLANSVNSQQNALKAGITSGAILKPSVVYADICLMLDDYISFHPESKIYVESLRLFYKLVAEGKLSLGGQLIFAFKDNAVHPLYQVGDIVVVRNGDAIMDYASLAAAVEKDKSGWVEFYRPTGGDLVLHKERVPETSVLVGYLEVGEY